MVDGTVALAYPSLTPDETATGVAEALAAADAALDAAIASPPDDADGLFRRLDAVARTLGSAKGRLAHPQGVEPDAERRAAAGLAREALEGWLHVAAGRADLAAVLEALTAHEVAMDDEARTLLARWRAEVRLTGAGLPEDARAEVTALRAELTEVASAFRDRLGSVSHIEVARSRLGGLPDDVIDAFGAGSTPGTVDIELTEPVQLLILEHADDRALREQVTRVRWSRGGDANRAAVARATEIRRQLARLLGARSWAGVRIESRMARTPEAVEAFLLDLVERLAPIARRELEVMRSHLDPGPGDPPDEVIREWDWLYLDHAVRAASGFDIDAFRDYLSLDDVFAGMTDAIATVFGVRLEPLPGVVGWHPDVRAYRLVDVPSDTTLGSVLVDPYARDGKTPGAWADILDPGDPAAGRLPVMVLVANANGPDTGDSRLTPDDVDTLFHEFGHVIDITLAAHRSRYWLLNDSWTLMDWIEAPSQFLGRWGLDPAVLGRFARHRETGAPIPTVLIDAFREAETRNLAVRALRSASLALFDLRAHGPDAVDVERLNRETAELRLVPYTEGTFAPGAIAHLMDAYDAGFYGYLWAEVLSDDLMTPFREGGMLEPETGRAYRSEILELPILGDPMPGVRRFLGREPNAQAYLARVSGVRPPD